ncbi:glycosyltransferase family 9 protein [Pseudodesulfovibrio cashew]|uniref:Glycosyltransferase family 9 protein n=1 Tax=Pseudodesulfovibrio cashew TaxID=2678688 RepID=A0A6I6JFW4_9BACT|nr:glycosyltransferase family 9 protein [Pseudodesulfovibrio cashew]QGY41725.1 glycosyltransferase family 9 protein [Pseudodesulfovibrio cashew]
MPNSGTHQPSVAVRLSHMGDVALTTGVLAHWNQTRGETFVFLTRKGNAPLLENHPAVERVIGVEDEALKTGAWLRLARQLAAEYEGHDLIDLHGTLRSRLLSLLWRGKVRRYPKLGLARRLYDRTHGERYRRRLEATNVPQRYALALDAEPPSPQDLLPRIFLTPAEVDTAATRLTGLSSSGPLVALHPYATHPAKQWPREHWLALTRELSRNGLDWVVVGRDDAPLLPGDERDLTNATNLRETCALLSRTDLLITGDSGPMHLGCAVGTPVLALFGPTAKVWGFYPAGPRDQVLERPMECRPCSLHGARTCERGHSCLAGIPPEKVAACAAEMLAAQ